MAVIVPLLSKPIPNFIRKVIPIPEAKVTSEVDYTVDVKLCELW